MKRPLSDSDVPCDSTLFDFLLENTPDQIYFKDREGRFIRISRAVAEYLNVANPRDLIGKTDFDLWSEETARAAAADERWVMETGEPMVGKVEQLTYPDGRVAWDYSSKLPLRNSAGEIIGICGINKEFTKVKEMEDALREERNQLRVLTTELAAKNAQIEADLQMAKSVQEALLPTGYDGTISKDADHLSFSHLYLPAAAVGGDLYHIFPLSKGRVGIFICDVMGHGVRAALITAVIRALMGELRPERLNPGKFLSALNQRLRSILERVDEPFVATAFYFVADPVGEWSDSQMPATPSRPSCTAGTVWSGCSPKSSNARDPHWDCLRISTIRRRTRHSTEETGSFSLPMESMRLTDPMVRSLA